jgi:hypothetical protein
VNAMFFTVFGPFTFDTMRRIVFATIVCITIGLLAPGSVRFFLLTVVVPISVRIIFDSILRVFIWYMF